MGVIPNILVASVKGGSGKTLVSCNLAYRLSQYGPIGLLDADIDSPHLPTMMQLEGKVELDSVGDRFVPIETQGIRHPIYVVSWGLMSEMKNKGVTQSGEVHRTIVKDLITRTKWGPLTYRIVDMPAGSGDEFLAAVKTFKNILGVIAVTQPNTPEPLLRVLDIIEHYGLRGIGVVENQRRSVCHCGKELVCVGCLRNYDPYYQSPEIKDVCKSKNIKYLGAIPIDPRLATGWKIDANQTDVMTSSVREIRELRGKL
jgi:ATP-binding protein involved in chromosome partitioning